MNREIESIHCSCGDKVKQVQTTDEEERQYGCGPRNARGCCVRAYECPGCGVRWTVRLAAPEMSR